MSLAICFLVAFAISSFVSFFLAKISEKNNKIFRTGGIAIISSFVITLLFSEVVITPEWQAVIFGTIVILMFGIWDDFLDFTWKRQIIFQIFLALVLIWFGYEIGIVSFSGNEIFRLNYLEIEIFRKTFSLISAFFITFWLVGIINTVNWLDGSDGLLSIAGILSLGAVLLVSLRPEVNQPAVSLISIIAIGSLVGFLVFNFPRAKIEAGTSGSYFVGFLLASLAIAAGTKIATTMVILILPVVDFIWVILERLKEGKSVFKRDNKERHLHYKLLSKGFSQRQILLGYFIFLGGALIISLFIVNQTQKLVLLIVEFLMIVVVMLKLNKGLEKYFKKMKTQIIFKNPAWALVIIISVVILFGVFGRSYYQENFPIDKSIEIGTGEVDVRIVQTPEETYKGLSGVKKMPSKSGMLFIYNQISYCSHVMRGMEFDLDFVFLKDGQVVHLEKGVSKDYEGVLKSSKDCNQVLEINAGEIDKLEIKVGDKIIQK